MNPYSWLKRTSSLWPAGHDGHLHQKYARYEARYFPIGVKIAATKNGAPRASGPDARRGKGKKRGGPRVADAW